VITRSRGSHYIGTSYIVIPHSGTVRITHAPLGPKVITSAQRHGELEFTGRRGMTGTLNLGDYTATLATGQVIHARAHPFPRQP
jgi:hypothetical protein